jgi:3-methylfumaryl-CoA hydratase
MSQDPIARVMRREICTEADIRRVATMLNISPEPVLDAGILPRGWQFLFIRSDAPGGSIRTDGFLGLGIALPTSPRSRVVLAGREVFFFHPIPIEAVVQRTSEITEVSSKDTEGGPLTFVTVLHQIQHGNSKEILLEERQTYILMDGRYSETIGREKIEFADCTNSAIITPSDLTLFQYSALCFNPHRIHYDRLYAATSEGYPDLVVNGGLVTLFTTEYLRNFLAIEPASLKARHRVPLFVGRPLTIAIKPHNNNLFVQILNDAQHKAAEFEVII